ncbi:hypothetical protein A33Q_0595 [Indibacter alkaliphilus LW1]|uniref:Uncharacterized protein n=1 Tax=Indibacter alkaliphilus (strain CCUG 57479 / KCTC 22604 / LW1) TaxID=1189612 RepID=S2DJT9_INDAL|nr:hypothetical protein [Indibacter alkaliphilus]EOZ99217.1 hypothetical protein A33Q_0595 [Indibacter alkaliphilus LW1]
MELEEMKNTWQEMSKRLEKQEILTNRLIENITKEKYKSKFSKLMTYELIGALICFSSAVFIAINFEKLETWYLMSFGLITIISLLVLPLLTLSKLNSLKKLNIAISSHAEVLIEFHKAKKAILDNQKVTLYLSILLAAIILPVTSKIFKDNDLFHAEHITNLWLYIPVLFVFLFFLSRWVFKGYKSATNSAEQVLNEIDS